MFQRDCKIKIKQFLVLNVNYKCIKIYVFNNITYEYMYNVIQLFLYYFEVNILFYIINIFLFIFYVHTIVNFFKLTNFRFY